MNVLLLATLWYLKTFSSLPIIYHRLSSKRGIALKEFRKLERLSIKLAKKQLDKTFFTSCLDLRICPKFLKFKPPKLKAYNDTSLVLQQVLRQQIEVVDDEKSLVVRRFAETKHSILARLSFMEGRCLLSLLKKFITDVTKKDSDRMNKKLLNVWTQQRSKSPDCLINLSSKSLSVKELNGLYLGLNHHILPKLIDSDNIKCQIEKAVYSLRRHTGIFVDQAFRDNIKYCCNYFTNSCRNVCSTRSNRSFHNTLHNLAEDKSIKLCKYDKGNGVVILNSVDYYRKLDDIVLNSTKFTQVNTDIKIHPVIKNVTVLSIMLTNI